MCHMSCVTCYVSGVTVQGSGIRCEVSWVIFSFSFVVDLVGWGSLINGAYPFSLKSFYQLKLKTIQKFLVTFSSKKLTKLKDHFYKCVKSRLFSELLVIILQLPKHLMLQKRKDGRRGESWEAKIPGGGGIKLYKRMNIISYNQTLNLFNVWG